MPFVFGNTRTSQKLQAKELKSENIVLKEHFVAGEKYYLFLVDEILHKVLLDLLIKDIEAAKIKSYLIVSSIMTAHPKEDSTVALLSIESNWRQYVTFDNVKCSCIVSFGPTIRILNKSADVTFYDFIDDKFNPPRYWCGSEFVGGPDCWIYPVAQIKDIYPISLGNDYVNMYTRYFKDKLQRILKDDMSSDELDMRPYEIIVPTEQDEVTNILKSMYDSELLAADTETDGFDFTTNRLGTLQLSNDGVKGYVFDWKLIDKRVLKQVFKTAKRITLVNAKFDVKFIWQNGVSGWLPTDDCALLSHAINSDRSKGLKPAAIFYCGKFTGYDLELDEAKKKFKVQNYLQIPKHIFNKYSGLDPIVTWRIQRALDKHVQWIDKHIPNEKVPEWTIERWYRDVMMPNANVVTQIELEGVYFSPEKFDIAEKAISEKIATLKKTLATEWNVPEDTDFSSTTKLGQLFKQMGWPEIEQSKAGNYKTSDPVLTEYERLGMPGIKTLKELRSYNVAMGTFINGWKQWMRPHEDGTWRIHPNCNTFGTSSFRHAMNDPNFQQIPSASVIAPLIKKLFTTPEKDSHDWLIVDADFRSLQMILAFADCGLNDKGIDQIAYDIYGPKGNQDAHAVTAYNTFCSPTHLPIIEIEDEQGNKTVFGEEQKIVIKGRAVDQEEQTILGKEFQEHDEFIKYA